MHFFKSLCAVAVFAASVAAQKLAFTSVPTNVETEHSYTITYSAPNSGPVTILLKQGNPKNLRTVATLTTTATGGSYVWSPAYNLVSNTNYALEIEQGSEVNYSGTIILNAGRTPGQGSVSPKAPTTPTTPVTPVSPVSPTAPVTPVSPYQHSTTVYESTTVTSYCPSSTPTTYLPPPPIVTGTGTGIPIPRNTTFYSATIPASTVAPTYPPPAESTPVAPTYTPAPPPVNAAVGLDAHIAMVFGAAAMVAALA